MRAFLKCLALATVTSAPLARTVTIGPTKIELEETTFAAVARHLGEAPITRAGDAGGSRSQACYVSSGSEGSSYYLESSEMGGGERITQIDIVAAGYASAAEEPVIATHCRGVTASRASVRTNTGVALGVSRSELEHRLNVRGRDSAGVTLYERSAHVGRGARAYDVSSWLRVRYEKGRIVAFSTGVVSSS